MAHPQSIGLRLSCAYTSSYLFVSALGNDKQEKNSHTSPEMFLKDPHPQRTQRTQKFTKIHTKLQSNTHKPAVAAKLIFK